MAKNRKQANPMKGANPALNLAMLGKRGSSAAGPHKDKRNKRARTRGAAFTRAMRDES